MGKFLTDSNGKILFPEDYTLLDIETTGLSAFKNEIIELSAIKVRKNKVIDRFSELVKPKGHINSFITKLTGISSDMVKTSQSIENVLPKFVKFIDNDIIMGHNVKFDIGFIQENLARLNQKVLTNPSVDTMLLARKFCKLPSHSLENLAKHYCVSAEGHHRALNDCMITHSIYNNIREEFADAE